MSRLRTDGAGRLAWICRSCTKGFWASLTGVRFGCHTCGSTNVVTLLDGGVAAAPSDPRLAEAVAAAGGP